MAWSLVDIVDIVAGNEAKAEVEIERNGQPNPEILAKCQSLRLVGPSRSGKTVISHAIARELILPPVMGQLTKFEAEMGAYPKIDFSGGINEPTNTDQLATILTDDLSSYVDRTGLQTLKTLDINGTNDLTYETERTAPIRRDEYDLLIGHELVDDYVNLTLEVSDLSGEWFDFRIDFHAQILKSPEDALVFEQLEGEYQAFVQEIVNAVRAGVLMIAVPFRYPQRSGQNLRVMIGMYLKLLAIVTRTMLQAGKITQLPQVIFCFTKYESVFSENEFGPELPEAASTKKFAHKKLSEYFTENPTQVAIWREIRRFYASMASLSRDRSITSPPSIWLACMSAFGFTKEGRPNLGVIDPSDTDTDVLAESSFWREHNENVGDFQFDIEENWRPLGIMQPFYMIAAPHLNPSPDFLDRARKEERPMLHFLEFARTVAA